jgi:hypothetical protein
MIGDMMQKLLGATVHFGETPQSADRNGRQPNHDRDPPRRMAMGAQA